jgi:methionyl aminopeptidase
MSIKIKTEEEIILIKEGGKKLSIVKEKLREAVKVGVTAKEIDDLAFELIKKEGAEPSFPMVPKYRWATCINVNEGVVHGIPHQTVVFADGDIVSVDVGLYFKGFHTDTSFSLVLGNYPDRKKFLAAGEEALSCAIKKTIAGNRIYDISEATEKTLLKYHLTPIEALVGHGVGRQLHEDPQIPCFTSGKRERSPEILPGMVLAVEIMYTLGDNPEIDIAKDGWTIVTHDGTISALFEETVIVEKDGQFVATASAKS